MRKNVEAKFNDIYEETYSRCLKFVLGKCSTADQVPDIMQDIYIDVFKAISNNTQTTINSNEAFVIAIAKKKIYRYYQGKSKENNVVPLFKTNENGETYSLADLDNEGFDNVLEDEYISKDTAEEIWGYVLTKSQDVQKTFYLYYYVEMTISEIAENMGVSQSTVKNRIYRTVAEIRRSILSKEAEG